MKDRAELTQRGKASSRWKSRCFKFLFFAGTLLIMWVMAHQLYFVSDVLEDNLEKVNLALVFGIYEGDSQGSVGQVKNSLDKTFRLYQDDYFDHILVNGGLGKDSFDKAIAMKDYLVSLGVPGEQIIVESGCDTLMAIQSTHRLMKEKNFDSVMVITKYYHLPRVKLAFNRIGVEEIHWAKEDAYQIQDLKLILKEFVAYYIDLFKLHTL